MLGKSDSLRDRTHHPRWLSHHTLPLGYSVWIKRNKYFKYINECYTYCTNLI